MKPILQMETEAQRSEGAGEGGHEHIHGVIVVKVKAGNPLLPRGWGAQQWVAEGTAWGAGSVVG